jgi:serine/threonine-protein kinase
LEHDAIAVALQAALGGRVLLIRTIGEGGMGRVYLGRDPQLKRFVAVKVLLQSLGADEEAHARFQREAQAIAAVTHANVVAIYGVGELPDGTPYFIMQHVAGGSMAERLAASGPLPIDVAESVLGDVAAALAAAHKRGIVHRDVKPANVLWDEEGERATVSDFGIASLQESEGDEGDMRITASGMAVGSPAYMSPEQLLTEPITPKSDIYALGLLGYELLTGHGPYAASSPSDIVAAHLRDTPRRLSELRPDAPPNLENLLYRCLSKLPDERPSAEEVMLALTPGAADALEWPPPGLERARGALWRLMLMPAVGTVFLLFPLLLFVKIGSSGLTDSTLVWPLVLAASSLLGFAAFAHAGLRAWRLRGVFARAAALGYAWGTILEVMADRRGDSGSLIAGTREYATLPPRSRADLRRLRVLKALLLFLAAPLALLAAVGALMLRGSERGGDTLLVYAVTWAVLAPVACGLACVLYERARLAPTRRRRVDHSRHTSELEFAPAWYAAFERSRDGQPFGPGRPVRRMATILLLSTATLAVLLCAAIIFMAGTITATGQLMNSSEFIATGALMSQSQRSQGGASYRLPPDGHTTPVEAGEALLAIASTARRSKPSAITRAVSADYPIWRSVTPPPDLFPGAAEMPWTSVAIIAAGKGLTAEQRTVLEKTAAHPARDEFTRAALASSADPYGALLKLPLATPIGFSKYPSVWLYAVTNAAESHAARVALDIADHRPADAERHAREIIAVGALLIDLHLFIDNLTGLNVLGRGVNTLEAVYVVTGRERDARVLLDSVVRGTARRQRFANLRDPEHLRQAMHDTRLMRGARMELLLQVLVRSCADPKQLLFGVDDNYRSAVAYARDSLAHFPSERVWVDALGGWFDGATTPSGFGGESSVLTAMANTLDRVVGGHRFRNCAALAPIGVVL